MSPESNDLLFPVLGLAAGLALLAFGFLRRLKARSFQRAPLVPVGGDSGQTPLFISGSAESPAPVNAPLSGEPCVFYAETVDQRERSHTASGGRTTHRWVRVADNLYGAFFVRDGGGAALVVPTQGSLDLQKPETSDSNELLAGEYDEVRKRTERIIRPGEAVTVLGTPRPLSEFLDYLRRNEGLALPTDLVKQLSAMENDPAAAETWCFFGDGVERTADQTYADYLSGTASSAASLLAAGGLIAALGAAALLHALKVF